MSFCHSPLLLIGIFLVGEPIVRYLRLLSRVQLIGIAESVGPVLQSGSHRSKFPWKSPVLLLLLHRLVVQVLRHEV